MHSQHRPAVYAILGVLVGVLVVTSLSLLVRTWSVTDQIREAQVVNTKARKSSDLTLAAIRDCTQPAGDCYKRGQDQTAAAVGDINRVVVLAAACSVGLEESLSVADRQSVISQCVIDRLAASTSHPNP